MPTKEPTTTAHSTGDIPHKSFSSPDTQLVDSSTKMQPQRQQVYPCLHQPGIIPLDLQESQQLRTARNISKQCIPNACQQHSAVQPTQAMDNSDPAMFAAAPRHSNFPSGMQLTEQIQDQRSQQRGQPPQSKLIVCRKCRQEGHYRRECVNGSFCSICKKTGHQNRSHKRHVKNQEQSSYQI